MNNTTIGIYIALVLIPILPLLLTWKQVLVRRDSLEVSSVITGKLPLLVVTASCLLFLVNLLFLPTTGVVYSYGRVVMNITVFCISLAMVVLSVLGKSPFRWPLIVAALGVTLVWLYAWAISAAV